MSSLGSVPQRAGPFLIYGVLFGVLGFAQAGLTAFGLWHGRALGVSDAFALAWLSIATYNFRKYVALRTSEIA